MFIANWKMNGSEAMLKIWLAEIKENLNQDARSSCILCPPVCFISQASKIIQRDDLGLAIGAQDVDPEIHSALTGGISGSMLKDLGSEYVIVGHSERRVNFNESSSLLKSKLEAATISGLRSNEDLILKASGTGDMVINDTLTFSAAASTPTASAVTKIYNKTASGGGTGLFFINSNISSGAEGELISKKKATALAIALG